jgi:hypothetical protein
MAAQDQLEIINSHGEIRFHILNGSGITNIGRHPDNDIVVDSPVVAPFHAVLDHQHKPYRLIALNSEGAIKVSGQLLQPNIPKELRNWDTIELDGHSLILMEGGAASGQAAPSIAPAPLPVPIPPIAPATVAAPPSSPSSTLDSGIPSDFPDLDELDRLLSSLPEDRSDDVIIVEPLAQNGAIDPNHPSALDFQADVEQPATMQVNVTNAGDLVGEFVCEIRGIDPSWVAISPPSINLNDGQRGSFSVAITAPRLPSSRAKAYYFSVVVTSPNYPGRMNSIGGLFVLRPFYAYSVGDIDPRKQKVSYSKRVGQSSIPITNQGNSLATFNLMGEDERHAATIEFDSPEEGLKLVGQVQVKVQPESTQAVPIFITPRKRRFVAFGGEDIQYTVTVTPLEGDQPTPRSVLAQAHSQPFMGPIPIILLVVALLLLGVWFFTPRVNEFAADKTQINSGEDVVLRWQSWPFVTLKLEPAIGKVEGPEGSKTVAPLEDTTYVLTGETFLTGLMPQWFTVTKEIRIDVAPLEPQIISFTANTKRIKLGDEVIISWDVIQADSLILNIGGSDETLPADQLTGSRSFRLEQNTIFELRASSRFGTTVARQSVTVEAFKPTETPLPEPIIQQFDVLPLAITAGDEVTITWDVKNVSKVTIEGVEGELPPSGTVTVRPLTNTAYVLKASNGKVEKQSKVQQVIVSPPPPATPVPGAPKIDFFLANPSEVGIGTPESKNIVLSWQVSGDATNVEITGPNNAKFSGLLKNGTLTITADKATLYVLTAFNGPNLKTSATVQIKVKNPVPKITSISPSSSSNVGGSGFVLTVNGSGFTKDSKVQWAGSNHTTVFVNESKLTASILAEDMVKAGTFEVKVFNPSPGGGTSGSVTFTLNNPVPTLASISPASVTKGSPSITLTVNGTNFVSGSVVRFLGADAPTTFVSSTTLTAQLTPGQLASPGKPLVVVFNPGPGGGTSNSLEFVINASNPVPTINDLSNVSAPGLSITQAIAGSTDVSITVRGTNFIQGSLVAFKSTYLTTTYVSDSELTAVIPQAKLVSVGTFKIRVSNPSPGGGLSNSVDFEVIGLTVTVAPVTSPANVALNAFIPMAVTLGSPQSTNTAVSLSTNAPSLIALYEYTPGCSTPAPTILASVVTIPNPATTANFCVKGLSEGNATITASLPSTLGGATDDVVVTVFGNAPVINALSVPAAIAGSLPPLDPQPSIVNAAVGVGSSNFKLTITGANFKTSAPKSQVQFGAYGPLTADSVSSTTIVVTINSAYVAALPPDPSVGINVTVINPGSVTSAPANFFINAPVLTGISPNAKTAGQSQFTLTLTGENFVAGSTVNFNGTALSQKPGGTSTQITVDVPASSIESVGTLPVYVINPGGFNSLSQNLTVTDPTITLSPANLTTTVGAAGTVFTVTISPVQSVARTVDLTGVSSVTLRDSSCVSDLATPQIPIPAGSSSAQFCVIATAVTASPETLTATLTGFTGASATDSSSITVNAASAAVRLVSSDTTVVSGESVTFTAYVTSNGGTPTGSITFTDSVGSATLCLNVTLDNDAPPKATCTIGIAQQNSSSHVITATFTSTNPNIASGATNTVTETIAKADTSVSLTKSTTTAIYGQTVTFTADLDVVSPGNGSPTGTIELKSGSTTLKSTTLAGVYDLVDITPSSLLNAGTYSSLTSFYSGDNSFNSDSSLTSSTLTISKANTSVSVSTNVTPSIYGQLVTFTATVTNTDATGVWPTGTIDFKSNGSTIGTCSAQPLSGSGNTSTATCSTSTLTASATAYTITATYDNTDGNFFDTVASTGTLAGGQTVNKDTPTLTITSDTPDPSIANSAYTVSFTLTGTYVNPTTGSVTVSDGTDSCTDSTAPYTSCLLTSTTFGSKTLTASYAATTNYNADSDTTAHTVNADLQLSAPSPDAVVEVGGGADSKSKAQFTVTLAGGTFGSAQTINLTSSNGNVGFTDCSTTTAITSVQTVAASYTTATFCAVGLSAGTATITATHNISGGDTATSTTLTISNPTVTLSEANGCDGSPPYATSSATLTATISAAQTTDTSVSLSSSATSIGTVPSSVTIAFNTVSQTFSVTKVANGTTTITATLPSGLGSDTDTCDVRFN